MANRKQQQQQRRTTKQSRNNNMLPERRNLANNPPTINQKVFQLRRFRHVIPAGGTSGIYSVLTEEIFTDFGIPATATPFQIESISAWAFADPTVPAVTLTLQDDLTGKAFSDSGQIGQPAAKVSYRFPLAVREPFWKSSSGKTFTNLTFTVGPQVVVDIVVSILI